MIRVFAIFGIVLAMAFTFACSDDDDDSSGDDATTAASDGASVAASDGASAAASDGATDDATDSAESNQVCASLEVLESSRNAFSTIGPETTVAEIDEMALNLQTARAAVVDAADASIQAELDTLEESLDLLEAEIQTVQDEGAGDGRAAAVADAAADSREDISALADTAGCS